MPLKKRKLVAGQLALFGTAANTDQDTNSALRRRKDIVSWCMFAKLNYMEKYRWMEVCSDGIHCLYCKELSSGISGSCRDTFIFEPFQGKQPDVLCQHEQQSSLDQHKVAEMREAAICEAKGMCLQDTIKESLCITAGGEAFCNALCILYFLVEREMVHTTNFISLRQLCIDLGNKSLSSLELVKNATYASE